MRSSHAAPHVPQWPAAAGEPLHCFDGSVDRGYAELCAATGTDTTGLLACRRAAHRPPPAGLLHRRRRAAPAGLASPMQLAFLDALCVGGARVERVVDQLKVCREAGRQRAGRQREARGQPAGVAGGMRAAPASRLAAPCGRAGGALRAGQRAQRAPVGGPALTGDAALQLQLDRQDGDVWDGKGAAQLPACAAAGGRAKGASVIASASRPRGRGAAHWGEQQLRACPHPLYSRPPMSCLNWEAALHVCCSLRRMWCTSWNARASAP